VASGSVVEPERVRAARPSDEPGVRAFLGRDHEVPFSPGEWVVLEALGRVVGCGQMCSVAEGGTELAFFDTLPSHRGRGLSRSLLVRLLLNAERPVYSLALPLVLAQYAGFKPIDVTKLPPSIYEKARQRTARGPPPAAMRLLGTESALLRAPRDPNFPEDW
jgi:N-acetylglutamate synthase-like GNAT family acetyltransferase